MFCIFVGCVFVVRRRWGFRHRYRWWVPACATEAIPEGTIYRSGVRAVLPDRARHGRRGTGFILWFPWYFTWTSFEGPFAKRQCKRRINSVMTLVILLLLKMMTSPKKGLRSHSGAIHFFPLFSVNLTSVIATLTLHYCGYGNSKAQIKM